MIELKISPTYKQHLCYEALKDPKTDIVFLGGGAGGGKSWAICESRLINALRFPGYKSYIGRDELTRLMSSTYETWCKVCNYHKVYKDKYWHLNGQYHYIQFENGSRIDLLDLKYLPSDPMYERFGSMEFTDGAIEEAGEVHFLAYDVLKSRVGRHMNKELGIKPTTLITGNPKKNWTYTEFYKPYREGTLPENIVFIQSLYMDNEYTAEDYGKQLALMKDKANKERLMFGNWEYDSDLNTLMDYDNITDLFTNVVDTGHKYIVCDVAGQGVDSTVIHLWEGKKLIKRFEFKKLDIPSVAQKIKDLAFREVVPYSRIIVDSDGLGVGVADILKGCKRYIANSTPFKGKDHIVEPFMNLKAQCSYKLADEVNSHQISIDIQDKQTQDKIIEELEQIKSKDTDKDSKYKIVPKEEVKEIIGRSPDDGDCLVMRMYFEYKDTGGVAHQFRPQLRSNKINVN
jgi:hypothetical protein